MDDPLFPLSLRLFLHKTVVSIFDSKCMVQVHGEESYERVFATGGKGNSKVAGDVVDFVEEDS